ncbi:cupin domain-containing protein, partial [Oceanospirillum multiglobuliferum]|uniref:cupin domain-containing protein n=1 Tax=Oceanospirillum multiglobuliferum TaxID=64969 RepID=UPI00111A0FD2
MEGYSSEWVAHSGDEFVYVLSGKVRYTLRKKDYELTAGDSLHFDAQHRHRVVNVGPGPAELIAVGTLPLFDNGHAEFEVLSRAPSSRGTAAVKKTAASGPAVAPAEPAKTRSVRKPSRTKSATAKK